MKMTINSLSLVLSDPFPFSSSQGLELVLRIFGSMGGAPFITLVSLAVYFFHHRKMGLDLLYLGILVSIAGMCLQWVAGMNPPSPDVRMVDTSAYSFPDINVARGVSVGVMLGFFIPRKSVRYTCAAASFLIAFSRLYLGVSYPRDLLGGVIVGLIVLFMFSRLIKFYRPALKAMAVKRDFSPLPMVFFFIVSIFCLLKIFIPSDDGGALFLGFMGGSVMGHFSSRRGDASPYDDDPEDGGTLSGEMNEIKEAPSKPMGWGTAFLLVLVYTLLLVGMYFFLEKNTLHPLFKDSLILVISCTVMVFLINIYYYLENEKNDTDN